MTRAQILKHFPNARESFIQRNLDPTHPIQNTIAQPPVQHVAAPTHARQEGGPDRFKVRITSFRCRLLDIDNLAGGSKFIIDALRYQGFIRDDSPDQIELSFAQIKVPKRTLEETVITIQHVPDIDPNEASRIYASAYNDVLKENGRK